MIFVDTGPIVAAQVDVDKWRPYAIPVWRQVREARCRLLTTELVVNEVATLLARRRQQVRAAEAGRAILRSPLYVVARPSREDDERALAILEKFPAHDVSFADCVSFVFARRFGVRFCFTFDYDHYPLAGLGVIPPKPENPPR